VVLALLTAPAAFNTPMDTLQGAAIARGHRPCGPGKVSALEMAAGVIDRPMGEDQGWKLSGCDLVSLQAGDGEDSCGVGLGLRRVVWAAGPPG
jgi:hypothetical protein